MAFRLAALLLAAGCDAAFEDGTTGVDIRPQFAISGAVGSHEPVGFRAVTVRRFDALTEDGWIFGGDPSLYRTATDQAAPESPPNIGEIIFPPGFEGGSGPIILERSFRTSTDAYLSFWFRMSAHWQGHQVADGLTRLWIAATPRFFWGVRGPGSEALRPIGWIQGTPTPPGGARWLFSNLDTSAVITRGQWHLAELVVRVNTPGRADGTYECWVDGRKIAEYRDLLIVGPDEPREWQILHWAPSWGGLGDRIRAHQTVGADHLYLSTRTWPNEPNGFAPLTDQPFDALTTLGWDIVFNDSGFVSIAEDPSAPLSPRDVIRFRYPTGFTGGKAPGTEFFDFPNFPLGTRKIFVGLWWKASNPWQGHPSAVNKIQFLFTCCSATGGMVMVMFGPPGGPYELRVIPQFSTSDGAWLTPNVHNVPISLGRWHRIEWLVQYDSAAVEPPTGTVQWWLDGHLIGDYRHVPFPTAPLVQHQLSPTWGGIDGVKTQNDFFWYDHVYISAR